MFVRHCTLIRLKQSDAILLYDVEQYYLRIKDLANLDSKPQRFVDTVQFRIEKSSSNYEQVPKSVRNFDGWRDLQELIEKKQDMQVSTKL